MSSRTNSHNISHAESIFSGDAYQAGAEGGGRGIPRIGLVEADLGTPIVADVNGLFAEDLATAGGSFTLDGALVTAGVATFDVPRGVQIVNAGASTSVITFTGTDQYGSALVESLTSNGATIVYGKKAFKTITGVTTDSDTTATLTAGSSDLLGLPFAVADAGDMYIGNENNVVAVPPAGTLAVAVTTNPATATTGDVRGTYDPSDTLDGATPVKLIYKPAGRTSILAYGVPQYGG